MAITFTDGSGKQKPESKSFPSNPANPADKRKERERKRLEMKQQHLKRQQERLTDQMKKIKLSDIVKSMSKVIAQDPNDDPQNLYRQVRPLLSKMGISNMADANKTEIIEGKTKKDNSLYKITLRRNAQLDSSTIERLNRNDDNFETMQWSSQAIELFVWYPYESEQTIPEPEE